MDFVATASVKNNIVEIDLVADEQDCERLGLTARFPEMD